MVCGTLILSGRAIVNNYNHNGTLCEKAETLTNCVMDLDAIGYDHIIKRITKKNLKLLDS